MNLYIIFIINLIISFVKSAVVKNESELKNILTNDNQEINITIESELLLNNELNIDGNFKKLTINGHAQNSSSINLSNNSQTIYFSRDIEEIELQNITIKGNIYFDNIKKVSIDNVTLFGSIDSNFKNIQNDYIKIKNFNYKAAEYSVKNCINLSGNVDIENSKFWGNSYCKNQILKHKGDSKYSFSVKNSYFSGEYQCSLIDIEYEAQSNIIDSLFEKGYCGSDISNGYTYIYEYILLFFIHILLNY